MEEDPVKNDARKADREWILGGEAVCLLCGERDPVKLVRPDKVSFEEHHVAGRAYDPNLTVTLCRNCHAGTHEDLRDAGVTLRQAPTILHEIEARLRATGTFLRTLGETLLSSAAELTRYIRSLEHPDDPWERSR